MTSSLVRTDAATRGRRAPADLLLVGLEAVLAVAAFGGAAALLSGAVPMEGAMHDVPFASPVLAGVSLGLIDGVLPTVAVIAELRRRRWAPVAHLTVGAALMGWIVVQIGFIGFNSWLQPAMFVWGATIFGLGYRRWRVA